MAPRGAKIEAEVTGEAEEVMEAALMGSFKLQREGKESSQRTDLQSRSEGGDRGKTNRVVLNDRGSNGRGQSKEK